MGHINLHTIRYSLGQVVLAKSENDSYPEPWETLQSSNINSYEEQLHVIKLSDWEKSA